MSFLIACTIERRCHMPLGLVEPRYSGHPPSRKRRSFPRTANALNNSIIVAQILPVSPLELLASDVAHMGTLLHSCSYSAVVASHIHHDHQTRLSLSQLIPSSRVGEQELDNHSRGSSLAADDVVDSKSVLVIYRELCRGGYVAMLFINRIYREPHLAGVGLVSAR